MRIIGGRSAFKGIRFVSSSYSVLATTDGKNKIVKKNAQRNSKVLGKIPVLRGILGLAKINPILIIVVFVFDVMLFFNIPSSYTETIDWILYPLAAAAILVYILSLKIKKVSLKQNLKYHAAEHMVINAYKNKKELTVENVMQQSRVSPRCGATLIVFMLIILIPLLFIEDVPICVLLLYGVSYELFTLAPKYKIFKPFLALSSFIQKHITTLPPDEKDVIVAIRGLKQLIELETGEK